MWIVCMCNYGGLEVHIYSINERLIQAATGDQIDQKKQFWEKGCRRLTAWAVRQGDQKSEECAKSGFALEWRFEKEDRNQ